MKDSITRDKIIFQNVDYFGHCFNSYIFVFYRSTLCTTTALFISVSIINYLLFYNKDVFNLSIFLSRVEWII